METPLTPLELVRRARALYADREAVVDEDLRLTYAQFFERCDRWSSALQRLGVRQGDRVAYIAPNTHAQLESFYAVPQIGAVLVPINYRLTADDFAYIIGHSGAKVVCAHADYLEMVDGIRDRIPNVEQFIALEGSRDGWLDYEALAGRRVTRLRPARDRRGRPPDHQLHQRHDGPAQGRHDHPPQRLPEHPRHPRPHPDDAGRSVPLDAPDVPRQRLDVHLDRDGGRREARLPAPGRPPDGVRADRAGGDHDPLRRADRGDRDRQRAGRDTAGRAARRARGDRRRAASRRRPSSASTRISGGS